MTVQYLIDSENVGDFWIPLLELPADKTELIVFYTRNSPHMSYESLIRLKESDRTVTFIKCYEGTNALDFQLVSELGYLIGKEEDGSFVIVTNDTGFDAAVKYWRRKKKSVKRITGKECKNLERRLKEDLGESRSSRQRPLPEEYPSFEPEISGESGNGELHEDGSQPAEETEQRSSRPVLRDAESAALPDPEEDSCEESAGETADVLQDDEADFDGPSYEDSDQEIYDDEDLPFTVEDDGSGPAEDEYAQPEEEESAEPEEYSEEGNSGEDGPEESDDLQPESGAAQKEDEKEEDHEELLSSDQSGQEPGDAGMNVPGTGAELSAEVSAEAGEDSLPGQKTGQPADETPESPEDPESFPHGGSDPDGQKMYAQENTEEEASSGTEKEEKDDQVLSSESSESGHRSKSRRSRTRRSRSGSRKQDQSSEDEQSGGNDEKQRHLPSDQEESADSQPQPAGEKADQVPDDEEIARIVACIGADNLAELHNQLATFYGDQGKDIYLSIKSNSRSLPVLKPDLGQKFAYYCEIIFARSDYTGEYPADISEFLLNAREKLGNLNSLRYALIKHYGKEKGRRFYFLLKPFAKTMYQM